MPTILGANTLSTGYNVANSLRFNDGSSDYLNFTPSSTGSRRTFTISFWFKQTNSSATRALFSTGDYSSGDGFLQINLSSSGRLVVDDYDQGGSSYNLRWVTPSTGPLFRDPSAWYHFVLAVDSTQGTQSNRVKFYVNGVDISSDFTQTTNTSQNDDFHVNTSSKVQQIGRSQNNNNYYDGYLAEFVMIDGLQLAPTSFGEFDEDSPTIWKPIDVSGLTFGTNGFYLDFEDSSSLGNDAAGSNNFTANNLAATDQSTDTCTNNFATLNPLNRRLTSNDPTYSEGNLKLTGQTGNAQNNNAIATIQHLTSGKWYFEVKCTTDGDNFGVGISDNPVGTNGNAASDTYYVTYNKSGEIVYGTGSSATTASYGNSYTDGDIIGVAFDLDNGALYFYKNGSIQNSGTAARTDLLTQMADGYTPIGFTNKGVMEFNFGGTQSFTISSGNADGRGRGNFEYSVPSGYFSVNTKNLAEFG